MSTTDEGCHDSKENQPDAIASSQAAQPLDGGLMFCDEQPPTTGEEPMHTYSKPCLSAQVSVETGSYNLTCEAGQIIIRLAETKPGTSTSKPDAIRRRSRRSVLGQGRLSVGDLLAPEPDKEKKQEDLVAPEPAKEKKQEDLVAPEPAKEKKQEDLVAPEPAKEKKQEVPETKLSLKIKNTTDYIKRLNIESTSWDDLMKDVEQQVEQARGLRKQYEEEASSLSPDDFSHLTATQRRVLQRRPNYSQYMKTIEEKLIQETIELQQILNQSIKHREMLKLAEIKCQEEARSCYEAAFPVCSQLDPKDVLYELLEIAEKSGTAQEPVLRDME